MTLRPPVLGDTLTAAAPSLIPPALSRREIAGLWSRHLLSLYLPLNALVFLLTGPHSWWVALLFIAPLVVAHQLDSAGFAERRQPPAGLPERSFDLLVYGLALLQFWVVFEVVRLFSVQGFFSFDMLMVFLVVGSASGFSIVTAHELIHRRSPWEQRLGRLLLCTVLYEHFYTEHLRGHHVRVGTPADPATARFGEAYEPFFRRTVPAQFRSAWRLEKQRLGDENMALFDPRMLHNRILHGLVLEWGVALGVLAAFGFVPFLAFVFQAFMAVRLLEAVNYFEHWGLARRGPTVRPQDSWDTHSWFTYYALIGLTRHADHHSRPSRPYQELRIRERAPVLPVGYVALVDMVMARNDDFQLLASEELARRRLGPFAEQEAEAAEAGLALEALARARRREHRRAAPGPVTRALLAIPLRARRIGVFLALVVLTALGAHWESGGEGLGVGASLLLHAWILGSFVFVVATRRRLAPTLGDNASWVLAFAAIIAAGGLSEIILRLV